MLTCICVNAQITHNRYDSYRKTVLSLDIPKHCMCVLLHGVLMVVDVCHMAGGFLQLHIRAYSGSNTDCFASSTGNLKTLVESTAALD